MWFVSHMHYYIMHETKFYESLSWSLSLLQKRGLPILYQAFTLATVPLRLTRMTSGIDTVETGFPGLNIILGDQLVSSLWLCAWSHATLESCAAQHLVEVDLAHWTRTVFRLSSEWASFFVVENGVYWCSHKTDKNCHFYGNKWWLDPIDRCFF